METDNLSIFFYLLKYRRAISCQWRGSAQHTRAEAPCSRPGNAKTESGLDPAASRRYIRNERAQREKEPGKRQAGERRHFSRQATAGHMGEGACTRACEQMRWRGAAQTKGSWPGTSQGQAYTALAHCHMPLLLPLPTLWQMYLRAQRVWSAVSLLGYSSQFSCSCRRTYVSSVEVLLCAPFRACPRPSAAHPR